MADQDAHRETPLRPAAADGRRRVVACDLGRVSYGPAWDLQARLQARLVAAKRGEAPPAPHVLLLVEHPPVVTIGKSGDAAHVLFDEAALARRGIELYRVDRGGDVTYHGPGQLVAYPILDLDRFFTDIHRYLRELEEAVIGVCSDLGLAAGRVEGRTGVWIGPDDRGPERKVCAMGIRCSRWVTMHGLALNVSTELTHFDVIVPCGIGDRGVTSLARETGRAVGLAEAMERLVGRFAERFGVDVERLAGEPARAFLGDLLGTPFESPDFRAHPAAV
jgi:lipoyl(octanoyl) transferase